MKTTLMRRVVTAGTVLVMAATVAVGAYATVLDPVATRQGKLVSFGPLMDNGFPTSYKDSKAVRLEACITADDPLCAAAAGPAYDPALPLAFPTNFPDEFFYQLASTVVSIQGGKPAEKLLVETNLEGAFAAGAPTPGDQMVFARIRIKDVDVPDGVTWRITHPYGVDELTATAKKGITFTQDVGTVAGVFSGALNSRLGPFLKWDPAVAPAAPVGYIGDPGTLHKVVGSPYGTNYIKVEQKNADGSYSPVLGATQVTPGVWDDQFALTGRLAVNSGVDVDAAYFTGNDSGGTLDVYASSDAAQSIQVSANSTLLTPTILMRELDGRYYARIDVAQKIPAGTQIEVVNVGDKPPAKKLFTISDQVAITAATYNADSVGGGDLTVTATSSDTESAIPADVPVLTVEGFGPLVGGTATFHNVTAPPPFVKVTSSVGGSDSSTLTTSGTAFTTLPPVALFTAPTPVQINQPVDLNGTASTGDITTFAWSASAGAPAPVPTTTTGHATWTPSAAGTYTISLTVSGLGGTSLPATQDIVVSATAPVTAVATGPVIPPTRGQSVTLDSVGTSGAESILWSQVSGPPVTNVSSLIAPKLTFTYPLMKLPIGPAGHLNSTYAVSNAPVVMRLTATGIGGVGTSTADVTLTPTAETFTLLTARYRTRGDWRVTGTSNIKAVQTVAMVLGSDPTGPYIGQATVDAAGAFSFKGGQLPLAGAVRTVTYVSATGGFTTATLLVTP